MAKTKKTAEAAEAKTVETVGETMEYNGETYEVAESANPPATRKMKAYGTLKMKPLKGKKEDVEYPYTLILDGEDSDANEVELFFRYRKLPVTLEHLEEQLEGGKEIEAYISYKVEKRIGTEEDSDLATTFEAEGANLKHRKSGEGPQNIFNMATKGTFDRSQSSKRRSLASKLQLRALKDAERVLDDPNASAEEIQAAMTKINASL